MISLYHRLVRRLYLEHDRLSRNRNYLVFEAPEAARARRVAAHLRSVRNDLMRATTTAPHLDCDNLGRVSLTFQRAAVDASRVAWLTAEEYQILREDADVARRIDELLAASPMGVATTTNPAPTGRRVSGSRAKSTPRR